jgi:hypothetical protein
MSLGADLEDFESEVFNPISKIVDVVEYNSIVPRSVDVPAKSQHAERIFPLLEEGIALYKPSKRTRANPMITFHEFNCMIVQDCHRKPAVF